MSVCVHYIYPNNKVLDRFAILKREGDVRSLIRVPGPREATPLPSWPCPSPRLGEFRVASISYSWISFFCVGAAGCSVPFSYERPIQQFLLGWLHNEDVLTHHGVP